MTGGAPPLTNVRGASFSNRHAHRHSRTRVAHANGRLSKGPQGSDVKAVFPTIRIAVGSKVHMGNLEQGLRITATHEIASPTTP